MSVLEVQDLSVSFDTDEMTVAVLDQIAFQRAEGETL